MCKWLVYVFLIRVFIQNNAYCMDRVELMSYTYDNPRIDILAINAAYYGDIESLENALSAGANVNAQDDEGNTALMKAVVMTYACEINNSDNANILQVSYSDYVAIIKKLIDLGAHIGKSNKNGMTAFKMAMARQACDSNYAKYLYEVIELLKNTVV